MGFDRHGYSLVPMPPFSFCPLRACATSTQPSQGGVQRRHPLRAMLPDEPILPAPRQGRRPNPGSGGRRARGGLHRQRRRGQRRRAGLHGAPPPGLPRGAAIEQGLAIHEFHCQGSCWPTLTPRAHVHLLQNQSHTAPRGGPHHPATGRRADARKRKWTKGGSVSKLDGQASQPSYTTLNRKSWRQQSLAMDSDVTWGFADVRVLPVLCIEGKDH